MTNSSQAKEQLQQAIDAEIFSLEESIRVLRLRRNALSPISSLPPEVVTAIFSHLCPLSPDRNPDHHLARLRISHVCHQWREIALNHAFLWSHLNFTDLSLAGATEVLARAKSVPLYLEARVPDRLLNDVRYTTFRKEVQTRIPSVYHLDISAGMLCLHKTLEELVSSAPTLESLSLSSRGGILNRVTGDHVVIPATLFNGSAPMLSRLKIRNCEISWKSPLLKGLRHLEMLSPPVNAMPKLTAWLDALDEMPGLKTLALHSLSPIAPTFPFDVKRAATLPSLTHLEMFSSPGDCALILAHLDLPALTTLSVTVHSRHPNNDNMQVLLPYVARHAHGPQDTQPLQSVLFSGYSTRADILAWHVPDINVRVQGLPTVLAETPSTRVALSFTCRGRFKSAIHLKLFNAAMSVLPLDGLITLIAQDFAPTLDKQFWLRHSPQWPLLRHVQLAAPLQRGFKEMLLDYKGTREDPLLPSLKELALAGEVSENWESSVVRRMEQGVPLELLDLRLCATSGIVAFTLPSEDLINIVGRQRTAEAGEQMRSAWRSVVRGAFRENVKSLSEFLIYTGSGGWDVGYDYEEQTARWE